MRYLLLVVALLCVAPLVGSQSNRAIDNGSNMGIGISDFANIDGRQVEYVLRDQGPTPTVVFLNGHGATMQLSWEKVIPEVSAFASALAYNPLNYGSSDSSAYGVPQTGDVIIAFLRRLLLEELRLPPPYVLVGWSIGGLYSQLYAKNYPDEIAGVVLVDSSNPDQRERFDEAEQELDFIRGGIKQMRDLVIKFIQGDGMYSEIEHFEDTAQQVKDAPTFPNIPLTVITAEGEGESLIPPPLSWCLELLNWLTSDIDPEEYDRIWRELQQDLVELSPMGRQILAEKSGHFVQGSQPELVIQAIRDVLLAASTET